MGEPARQLRAADPIVTALARLLLALAEDDARVARAANDTAPRVPSARR